MTNYTYSTILQKAKEVKTNVKTSYKIGMSHKWSYYFAKALIKPNKDVKKITINDAPKPSHTHISRQVTKNQYLDLAKKLTTFIEKEHRMPNYLAWNGYKIASNLFTYTFARCLIYYDKYGKYDPEITVNQKVFTKPVETSNKVYAYFIKVFNKNKKVKTVDGILELIQGRGYGSYYDDKLSNKQVIDNLAKNNKDDSKDPNCTDCCQMVQNCIQQLVDWKLYKKVECLHVNCSSGGHVKLRITKNDGSTFIRDPACVVSHNGKPLNCVWCTNTPKAINPSWYMENLNR